MNERRTQLEIIHDMLKAIHDKGGTIKPTHLLYKSNLSHKRMKEYLDQLMERKLIDQTEMKEKQFFVLTDAGREFLVNYKRLTEFTDAFGL